MRLKPALLQPWIMAALLAWTALLFLQPVMAQSLQRDYATDVRYLYVQPGQTLHNIVRRLYPERKTEWKRLRSDIIRLNPHAFVNGRASSMRAGVKLTLAMNEVMKPSPSYPLAPKIVGEVVESRGRAVAVGRDKVSRKLDVGNHVYLGDKLVTGEDGFLRLRMIDNAQLDLRCFSIMVIEDYNLKSTTRKSVLNLLQGSLRKVTGEIGRWGEDVYQLKTPIANVGVRGTEYALRVFQSKGCDGSIDTGDDGLYLQVIKGLVDVENKAAKTPVAKGDTVYIPLPGSKPVAKEIDSKVLMVEQDAGEGFNWWYALGLVLLVVAL